MTGGRTAPDRQPPLGLAATSRPYHHVNDTYLDNKIQNPP
jgi:hypothetical protein